MPTVGLHSDLLADLDLLVDISISVQVEVVGIGGSQVACKWVTTTDCCTRWWMEVRGCGPRGCSNAGRIVVADQNR